MVSSPKLLISHPWVARGGSEATAMWTLNALQDDFDITFVTAHVDSWEELNSAYGTAIDDDKIRVIRAPKLPLVNSATRLVHLQHRYFEKFCHRLAPEFDFCISTYNPVNFGDSIPSIQLIGDFSFSEKMRQKLYRDTHTGLKHRDTPARRLYLKLGDLFGIRQDPLALRENDLIVANSQWAADQLAAEFDIPDSPILYPPVILPESTPSVDKRPLSFVCLGRISPEKEIEKVIEILRSVRTEHQHEVTLTLIGQLDDSDYSNQIETLISENLSWIKPAGFLSAEAKQNLLAGHEFALHGCRIEAFGIAVAEMASLGCVPIVPASGGAREIAEFDGLLYDSVESAVTKVVHLIQNPDVADQYRTHLRKSVQRFGPEAFSLRLREIIDSAAGVQNETATTRHAEEGIPASV